jgi:hypothetical protein
LQLLQLIVKLLHFQGSCITRRRGSSQYIVQTFHLLCPGNISPPHHHVSHHAEGLVNPKVHAQKKGYSFWIPPRAYKFRKKQIENRFPELALSTFLKTCFLVHKMWLKLAKIEQKWNF